MGKSSVPPLLAIDSSTSNPPHSRPKHLGLHESRITARGENATPQKVHSTHFESFDSANMIAAKRLRETRNKLGLTQCQAAELSGESRNQIQRREAGRVHLGALRLLVVLERVAKSKEGK